MPGPKSSPKIVKNSEALQERAKKCSRSPHPQAKRLAARIEQMPKPSGDHMQYFFRKPGSQNRKK